MYTFSLIFVSLTPSNINKYEPAALCPSSSSCSYIAICSTQQNRMQRNTITGCCGDYLLTKICIPTLKSNLYRHCNIQIHLHQHNSIQLGCIPWDISTTINSVLSLSPCSKRKISLTQQNMISGKQQQWGLCYDMEYERPAKRINSSI